MRRLLRVTVGLFAAVIIAAALVAGLSPDGKSLPGGPWGKLISCLQGHPLFAVYDATSPHASVPTASTTSVDVWQNIKGLYLARVTKFATEGGAQAAVKSAAASESQVGDPLNNVGSVGPVEYLFNLGGSHVPPQPLADTQNQLDITVCVEQSYATAGTALSTSAGLSTSTPATEPTTAASPARRSSSATTTSPPLSSEAAPQTCSNSPPGYRITVAATSCAIGLEVLSKYNQLPSNELPSQTSSVAIGAWSCLQGPQFEDMNCVKGGASIVATVCGTACG